MVAINSAIEIDFSGQVCADSIGFRIYSGIGGQMDFIRGAALSSGGIPIIALPSTAANGTVSRIVAALKPGAGVVTTRGHVHWVVTEYGAVNLFGKSLRERAEALDLDRASRLSAGALPCLRRNTAGRVAWNGRGRLTCVWQFPDKF